MENVKIETRQSKAGNDYQFVSGEGSYYLSALKKSPETIDIPASSVDWAKYLLYNRVLKGFVCKTDNWNIVKAGLDALLLPKDWKEEVRKVLPKANIFKSNKPANSSTKQAKKVTKKSNSSLINTLVEKLANYATWDMIPKESISKIQTVCETNDVKITEVCKQFNASKQPTESLSDLEL